MRECVCVCTRACMCCDHELSRALPFCVPPGSEADRQRILPSGQGTSVLTTPAVWVMTWAPWWRTTMTSLPGEQGRGGGERRWVYERFVHCSPSPCPGGEMTLGLFHVTACDQRGFYTASRWRGWERAVWESQELLSAFLFSSEAGSTSDAGPWWAWQRWAVLPLSGGSWEQSRQLDRVQGQALFPIVSLSLTF